ncbi:signal peptidase I [Solilutibacter silvestris]|uniref:Signal peptidase I n=1 Tax=Solilutibacter silvestris TaxID=1645665 RepID=A0A2K1PZP5_9GAMM|nr:signal peptidase I [Lysobacter silvestris]PNS08252.1 signal peptidase I [Lysobacter silvestris]
MRWFEPLLVILTLVTGLVWALDKWVWKRAPREDSLLDEGHENGLIETARSFFPVLAIVLVLRTFIAEPFRIPSGSMIPSLQIGDFILVNKFAYGLRLPISNTRIVPIGDPKRGDVVVFKYPGMTPDDPQKGEDFVKRVIGLPGDRVGYHMGQLTINGVPVKYQTIRAVPDGDGEGMARPSELRTEDLPGHPHQILVSDDSLALGAQGDQDLVVPQGQYFVMGDNRDNSLDGRFWGTLPEANLRGRAFAVWMHWGHDGINLSRVGHSVP